MAEPPMYSRTAHVYDLIYDALKDYAAEARALHDLILERCLNARTLLDVACGTGLHLQQLQHWYDVEGSDVEPAMLAVAAQRLPRVPLHCVDMRELDLAGRFDAITCLFSSVGHLPTAGDLDRAVAAMAAHLTPGGVLVVDGWLRPEAWQDERPAVVHQGARDGSTVVRMSLSRRIENRTLLAEHHLIGTPAGVEYIVEEGALTLFTDDEYRHAFTAAGLRPDAMPSPMPERDRYVGTRNPG